MPLDLPILRTEPPGPVPSEAIAILKSMARAGIACDTVMGNAEPTQFDGGHVLVNQQSWIDYLNRRHGLRNEILDDVPGMRRFERILREHLQALQSTAEKRDKWLVHIYTTGFAASAIVESYDETQIEELILFPDTARWGIGEKAASFILSQWGSLPQGDTDEIGQTGGLDASASECAPFQALLEAEEHERTPDHWQHPTLGITQHGPGLWFHSITEENRMGTILGFARIPKHGA